MDLHGAAASWIIHSSPDRAVHLRGLAEVEEIFLFSWARHLTLTEPYPGTGEPNAGGIPVMD